MGYDFCYHNIVFQTHKYCEIQNLSDYNDYILKHIAPKSHYHGVCICPSQYEKEEGCHSCDLIESLVSDSREISMDSAIQYQYSGSGFKNINEYFDNIESDIDDLINWKIPFRDNNIDTYYPISWLMINLEEVYRGKVDNIQLDNVIQKVKYQMELCSQLMI